MQKLTIKNRNGIYGDAVDGAEGGTAVRVTNVNNNNNNNNNINSRKNADSRHSDKQA